jgi:hypothetical protein
MRSTARWVGQLWAGEPGGSELGIYAGVTVVALFRTVVPLF